MSKKEKNNIFRDRWNFRYHFKIMQLVPDILKFGLKGAWQRQEKTSKILIIVFLVFILFKIFGVWEQLIFLIMKILQFSL